MAPVLKREHGHELQHTFTRTFWFPFSGKLQGLGDKCLLLGSERTDSKGQLLLNLTSAKLPEPANLGQCSQVVWRSWNKKPGFCMKNCLGCKEETIGTVGNELQTGDKQSWEKQGQAVIILCHPNSRSRAPALADVLLGNVAHPGKRK